MNIHTSVEYLESLDHQIQLRNVYIDILRREHVMQTGAPPPINFAAHVNDAEIKRAKKIYEKVQESMVLPRYITTEFLNKHDFKSGELYVNWEQAWERAVQGLSPYLKYKALTMTMTKGSAAHTAMENALRSAGFAALPTAQK